GMRTNAARLSERFLAEHTALGDDLVRLSVDADPAVRLQASFSLGEWADPRATAALVELARKDGADPYFAAAIMSSVKPATLGPILEVALKENATVLRELALQVAGAGPQ